MNWGSLLGFALLVTLSILVLRLLWHWLIVLIVLGPAAYAGIVAGHFVSTRFDSLCLGLLAAVLVAGLLADAVRTQRGRW